MQGRIRLGMKDEGRVRMKKAEGGASQKLIKSLNKRIILRFARAKASKADKYVCICK